MLILSAAECNPWTQVSGNKRFMQIFAGVIWRGCLILFAVWNKSAGLTDVGFGNCGNKK